MTPPSSTNDRLDQSRLERLHDILVAPLTAAQPHGNPVSFGSPPATVCAFGRCGAPLEKFVKHHLLCLALYGRNHLWSAHRVELLFHPISYGDIATQSGGLLRWDKMCGLDASLTILHLDYWLCSSVVDVHRNLALRVDLG